MIYGIGTDLCTISRVEKSLHQHGDRFVTRLLTPTEKQSADGDITPAYLAKRWAIKEATSKALGVGIGAQLSFQDITLTKTTLGQPILTVTKGKNANFSQNNGFTYHASYSDEEGLVTAFVIAEKA